MSQSESSTKDSTTKDGDKEAAAALTREKKRCKVLKQALKEELKAKELMNLKVEGGQSQIEKLQIQL